MSRTASSSAVSFDARSEASPSASRRSSTRSVIAPKVRISSARRVARACEEAESIVRRRRVEARDHAAEIYARRGRANEEARIDRRVEQRQLSDDALDVHAVADLEEPIRDRVPGTCRVAGWAVCRSTASPSPAPPWRRRFPGAR